GLACSGFSGTGGFFGGGGGGDGSFSLRIRKGKGFGCCSSAIEAPVVGTRGSDPRVVKKVAQHARPGRDVDPWAGLVALLIHGEEPGSASIGGWLVRRSGRGLLGGNAGRVAHFLDCPALPESGGFGQAGGHGGGEQLGGQVGPAQCAGHGQGPRQ